MNLLLKNKVSELKMNELITDFHSEVCKANESINEYTMNKTSVEEFINEFKKKYTVDIVFPNKR